MALPFAVGSLCFLVPGTIAYRAAHRHGWQPAVNLLGCVFFGISALAAYVLPTTGTAVNEAVAVADAGTCAGAGSRGEVAHKRARLEGPRYPRTHSSLSRTWAILGSNQ